MTSQKGLIESINKTIDKIRDMYEKKIHELEQELQIRTEQNSDLYSKVCNSIVQISEANEIIKRYKSVFSWCASHIHGGQELEKDIQEYVNKWGVGI